MESPSVCARRWLEAGPWSQGRDWACCCASGLSEPGVSRPEPRGARLTPSQRTVDALASAIASEFHLTSCQIGRTIRPMNLKPIVPRPSVVDLCVARLRDRILSGDLQPGDRLPPERVLAERFGVNRVTVRSALARLAAAHLLTVRQGSGHQVQDFRRGGGPELIDALAALAGFEAFSEIARDLLLVRRALARAVLERLVSSPEPLDTAPIEAAIDAFESAVDEGSDLEDLADRDMAVLVAIVDATHSPVLRLCINPIAAVLRRFERLRSAIYEEPRGNILAYRALLGALQAGQPALISHILDELSRRDERTVCHLSEERPS